MKTIYTLLILFSTSFLFAQNVTVEISDYPSSISEPLDKIKTSIDQGNPEKYAHTVDGTSIWVQNNRYGSKSYLKTDYQNANEKSYYAHFKKDDQEKGSVTIEDLTKGKTIGNFKIKSTKNHYYNSIAFSMDGKYLIAMGVDDRIVYSYVFDLKTKKLVVDERIVKLETSPSTLLKVGGSGNYMFGSGYYNRLFMVDIKTGKGTTLPISNDVKELEYLYPSDDAEFILAVKKDDTYFFNTKNNNLVFSKKNATTSSINKSFFISTDGQTITNISGKPLSDPGIGIISQKGSLVVFDQDLNYFTVSEGGRDILQYIQFNDEPVALEPQPNPIPIISDVLNAQKTAELFEKVGEHCQSYDNRKLAFQVFESAQPFSDELLKIVSKSEYKYVIEYMGKYVSQWVNNTPKIELAKDGKDVNIKRGKFLDKYDALSKKLSQEEFGLYLADDTEVENAKLKIKPLKADLYYMTVDELVEKGNSSIGMIGTIGPKAATLAITFYEVAAEKEPNEAVHQLFIANAYANADKYDEALQYYNKALAMKPDYPLALFGMTKTSFMPVQKGQKVLDDNLAKSIIANANRYLAVAPEDYISETKTTKTYKAFCQLYLDDQGLYAAYNLATGISDNEKRTNAITTLIPKVQATGNTFLVAYMANINGFDYIKIAESKGNDFNYYLKADVMLAKSVKGGVYDPETYYEWARININFLKKGTEGMRIVTEAQKIYPEDKNFGSLVANQYFNTGRDLYLKKSYTSAIPMFEKYVANAKTIVPKAYDYLGFSYYYTKNYAKAATNLQLVKDKNSSNTLHAYNPNFDAVLAYAKKPSGTAPVPQDNGDKIEAMEDQYEKGMNMGGAAGLKLMESSANYYDQINYDYGQAIAHSGVGVAYHRAGNTGVAKSHYQKCIDNGAQSSSCYNNLAMIQIKEKSLSSAKSNLDKGYAKFSGASDLKKTYAEYYIQMGFNEYGKKSYYSAITNFKKCISYNDSDAWAHMYLGYSYYATGKNYDAKSSLRRAIQIDPQLRSDYPAIGQILNQ